MSAAAVAYEHESGPAVESGRLGVWLLVGVEALTLGALGAAWAVQRAGANAWPDTPPGAPAEGAACGAALLLASLALVAGARAARRGRAGLAGRWLAAAAVLDAALVGLRWVELARLAATAQGPASGAASASHFALAGAHAALVLAAALWAGALAWRAWRGGLPPWRAQRVGDAALHQHTAGLLGLGVLLATTFVG